MPILLIIIALSTISPSFAARMVKHHDQICFIRDHKGVCLGSTLPKLGKATELFSKEGVVCKLYRGNVSCSSSLLKWPWFSQFLKASGKNKSLIAIPGLRPLKQISFSPNSKVACAITDWDQKMGGGVYCAGERQMGLLGDQNRGLLPYGLEFIGRGVRKVVAGNGFFCALEINHRVFCWGQTRHFFKNKTSLTDPKYIPGIKAKNIYAGEDRFCYLNLKNVFVCPGTKDIAIPFAKDPSQIVMSNRFICYLTKKSEVICNNKKIEEYIKKDIRNILIEENDLYLLTSKYKVLKHAL